MPYFLGSSRARSGLKRSAATWLRDGEGGRRPDPAAESGAGPSRPASPEQPDPKAQRAVGAAPKEKRPKAWALDLFVEKKFNCLSLYLAEENAVDGKVIAIAADKSAKRVSSFGGIFESALFLEEVTFAENHGLLEEKALLFFIEESRGDDRLIEEVPAIVPG